MLRRFRCVQIFLKQVLYIRSFSGWVFSILTDRAFETVRLIKPHDRLIEPHDSIQLLNTWHGYSILQYKKRPCSTTVQHAVESNPAAVLVALAVGKLVSS